MLNLCIFLLVGIFSGLQPCLAVNGWLNWRGPDQNGTSHENDLPDRWVVGGENHLWSIPFPGKGTPVIAENQIYAWGFRGEGPDLQEVLMCLDSRSGQTIWERGFSDFISDIIYNRYSIGSPAVDRETGHVFINTSPGLLVALDQGGKILWQHSLMEEFGRLTFPNGRTGSPVIDQNLVIIHGITTNWGKQGPARDRFYAFDKLSGDLVWASTPGVGPTDSSFSTPVFGWLKNQRVLYCGTGCGNVVCINVKTGKPLTRFQFLHGGVNSSVLVADNNRVVAIHGKENLDSSEIGRMALINMDVLPKSYKDEQIVLDSSHEVWRNPLGIFTSSPTMAKNRIYQVTHTGDLACVDLETGAILWKEKLSNSQLHASPLYADGKLYVPMLDGSFYIIQPTDNRAKILDKVQLEGNCLGAPAVWNGQIYVHTSERLYCFGNSKSKSSKPNFRREEIKPVVGEAVQLLTTPAEIILKPGDQKKIEFKAVDGNGNTVPKFDLRTVNWEKFIPEGAKVRSKLNATVDNKTITAMAENVVSAGVFKVNSGDLNGFVRGRILPGIPFEEDFEGFEIGVPHAQETGVHFAYPPLPWIGARFKWEVRELEGNKILTKTLDRLLFQRTTTFIGHSDMSNYTMSADVMSDGNRRIMSTVGLINQRYIIALKGNWQLLEVSSNHDRVKVSVPFAWKPKVWYRLVTRVDIQSDGSGIVRAKAWPREDREPGEWTLEVPHKIAHKEGSPGLFGFSPQSKKRVYIDNIKIAKNVGVLE